MKRSAALDWDDLAGVDPLWAVLSAEEKRNGGWKLDEFFATGEAEVERILATAEELGRPARREAALDYCCGVGRLTRALAKRFAETVGVDISESMVEQARQLNAGTENIAFEVADQPPPGPFDLVLSNLVLQHLPKKALARVYIVRLIAAGGRDGLVVFQLPTQLPLARRIQPRRRLYGALRRVGVGPERLHAAGLHPVRMLAVSESEVRATVEQAQATIARAEDAGDAGLRYYVHHRSP